ncbi:hypothetical protein GPECTOR_1g439 [Gonium pectorale]|uniref:Protein kinase domain-containing protein n=1 Tax=Gonium pectorale TaxID=33097 RepID=A0A150H4I7_GONPE|nr:hypothetical protein GPECTOR_1g439 [Gonium pectorale]|eukprot:KXZ56490.1 hypothetical protein GPECTOR_1g439 [Gonium pectorale]
MALPLWPFNINRSLSRSPLRLRNVTLVVPPAELALLRRLLVTPAAATAPEVAMSGEVPAEWPATPKPAAVPESYVSSLSWYFDTREAGFTAVEEHLLRGGEGSGAGGTGGPKVVHLSPDCRYRVPDGPVAKQLVPLNQAIEEWRAALGGVSGDDGDVRLLKPIGQGSYGVVFLGMWRGLPVAAKVLVVHDTLLGAEGRARQRAVLEAAVGASLDHPNVVATYAYDVRPLGEQPDDGGDESGSDPRVGGSSNSGRSLKSDVYQLHILQEFCFGGSLRNALESRRALGGGILAGGVHAHLALRLAFDVAAGLRHVHAAGIVHGDVAAGNVLLARRGPEDGPDASTAWGHLDPREAAWRFRLTLAAPVPLQVMAKVADFGLSVRLPGSATHASGNVQGTPAYTAPEVLIFGRVSRASDVYSFGMLLLELLRGIPLWAVWDAAAPGTPLSPSALVGHGDSASALVEVLSAPLRDSAGRCPAGLRALLEACLATDPAGRPTMEQVVEALVGCVESLALQERQQWEKGGPLPPDRP